MTDDRHHDDTLDPELMAAWSADAPPADFADRVAAAARAEPPAREPDLPVRPRWEPSRGMKWGAGGVVAICAVLLFVVFQSRPRFAGGAGEVRATDRVEVTLAHRGVAVAEPGAHLSWRVGTGGAAEVTQTGGDVFYRVEPGGPFSVDTPHGRVTVQGTCFRVEVRTMKPSKQSIGGAAIGAAVAAVLVVTVYEGKVLFAGKGGDTRAATAGETVVVPPGAGGPRVAGEQAPGPVVAIDETLAAPPPDGISRDELIARDERQRQQLEALRRELEGARLGLADARREAREKSADDDGRPWFDPSPETLRAFAKECRVRFDLPPVEGTEPAQIGPRQAERFGLTDEELPVVNEVLREIHAFWSATVQALYVEATGDAAGADSLSVEAMAREIQDKALPGEADRVRERIAQERAGLIPPPADWSTASPIERYLRHLAAAGDEVEKMFAARLGPERARELREGNGGWGMRMEMAGCPDDGEVATDKDMVGP